MSRSDYQLIIIGEVVASTVDIAPSVVVAKQFEGCAVHSRYGEQDIFPPDHPREQILTL